ncbi:MAG: hypothetical protein RMJ67_07090, partial [Elusimicrobiota bacterium]|nr:hypothetical protein [Endomicrobiia bacterium]MDW8166260.1 hypothetical protein [Elusimicrobiota bacterium]
MMDIPLIILSYIIPKDKNLYAFISGSGDIFYGNPKYLYFHFERKGKKVVYLCSNKKLVKK